MNIFKDFFNFVKKNCDDDVCLMIVFILLGFGLCFLLKDNISGFTDFAPFEKTISDDKVVVDKPDNVKMEESIGQVLRPMKPQPTPSTKKALEVMGAKEPVQKNVVQQKMGLMTDSATNFRPFDEIWNPGFKPLDMMFNNVQKDFKGSMIPKMGEDRPMDVKSAQNKKAPSPMNSEVNLVLLYAPWCGHSKRMLPDYERVKSEFDGQNINGKKINIIMYDSDVDKDKVKEYGVKGFPSLFIEKDGNREPFPHRTYEKISEYLNNL